MEPQTEEMKKVQASPVGRKALRLSICIMTILSAAVMLTGSIAHAQVEKHVEKLTSSNGATVNKLSINGRFVDVILSDGSYNGFLTVSRNDITGTTALDFSFATRDPENPNIAIFWSGVGEIPNSALTINATGSAAQLKLTTPNSYPITRCDINFATGAVVCTPSAPMSFDLTWVQNDFTTIFERTERLTTFGPVREFFSGAFSLVTASVNGTWDGHTMTDGNGDLLDTRGNTVAREIMIDPHE